MFILPANLGMRVIGPPRQLGAAVIFYGVCGTCPAAPRITAVIGLRILIGMGEVFVQVGLLYFNYLYKRDEVATRAGIPAIGFGLITSLLLPTFPDILAKRGSRYFSNDEIDLALNRMAAAHRVSDQKMKYSEILLAFKHPKSYFTAIIYGSLCLGTAFVTSFLPIFINQFGFDKRTCLVTSSLYPGVILTVSWITINHGGCTKQSTGWAMAQIIGQGLSIIETQIRRENRMKEERAEEFKRTGTKDVEADKSMDELLDKHPDFRYIL
ncbi:hypothetical protein DL98DRAFT_540666 [Cadophora sp. DSE1049]|nr:hypothetical protein DL98DRAFT_540666 [Cadophora sp. DSE1049]